MNNLNWVRTDYGFYTVDDDTLMFACEENDIFEDNICEVSDMTGLTSQEYNEVSEILLNTFNYELNGQFL